MGTAADWVAAADLARTISVVALNVAGVILLVALALAVADRGRAEDGPRGPRLYDPRRDDWIA